MILIRILWIFLIINALKNEAYVLTAFLFNVHMFLILTKIDFE